MKNISYPLLLISLFLTFTLDLNAQLPSVHIDSAVITASRTNTQVANTGRSISIVTKEEIAKLPVTTVDELLRFLPGINVNMRNAFGVQNDIGMRGSTFSQVLVLLDNQPINDPLTAHFNNNIPVPLAEIESIEIIRGPGSVAYGPDAVGGIIHIRTTTYAKVDSEREALGSKGQIGFGEHALTIVDGNVSKHWKKLQLSAAVKANIADGEELANPNYVVGNAEDSSYNNYFDLKTYTMAAAYEINENWRIYGRAAVDQREFSAKYFYTQSTFDESEETVNSYWSQFAISHEKNNHALELNLAYKNTEDEFVFNPNFTANNHTTELTNSYLNYRLNINDNNVLALGGQFSYRTIESNDRGNHNHNTMGAYLIWQTKLLQRLTLNSGLRIEEDKNFGLKVLPQISGVYAWNKLSVRSIFGRAIRAGDFTERFVSNGLPMLSPGRNLGNPELNSEESYSAEIGLDYRVLPQLRLSTTGFYRWSTNLIDYVLTNYDDIANNGNLEVGADYFYANNIAKSETRGVEIQANSNFKLEEDLYLQTALNYSFTETVNDSNEVSRYISNHPKHNFGFMLGLKWKRISLSTATNLIVRDSEIANNINGDVNATYAVTNVRINVQPFSEHVSLFAMVNNLFDEDYQEILGAQLPSRWIVAGLAWKL